MSPTWRFFCSSLQLTWFFICAVWHCALSLSSVFSCSVAGNDGKNGPDEEDCRGRTSRRCVWSVLTVHLCLSLFCVRKIFEEEHPGGACGLCWLSISLLCNTFSVRLWPERTVRLFRRKRNFEDGCSRDCVFRLLILFLSVVFPSIILFKIALSNLVALCTDS